MREILKTREHKNFKGAEAAGVKGGERTPKPNTKNKGRGCKTFYGVLQIQVKMGK